MVMAFRAVNKEAQVGALEMCIKWMDDDGVIQLCGSGSITTRIAWVENILNEYSQYHPNLNRKQLAQLALEHAKKDMIPKEQPFSMIKKWTDKDFWRKK